MISSDGNDKEILELLDRYADGGLDAEHCKKVLEIIKKSPELKQKLAVLTVMERLLRVHRIKPPSVDAIMDALPGGDAGLADELRKGSDEPPRKAGRKSFHRAGQTRGEDAGRRSAKGTWNRIQRQDERGVPVAAVILFLAVMLAGAGVWINFRHADSEVRRAAPAAGAGQVADTAGNAADAPAQFRAANPEAARGRQDQVQGTAVFENIPAGEVSVSQVKYTGQRCARSNELAVLLGTFRARTGVLVKPGVDEIGLMDPDMFNAPVLYMAGHGGFSFTAGERDQLGKYLKNGGFLFVESCCGREDFDKSFRAELDLMGMRLSAIPSDSIIYTVPHKTGELSVTPSLASKTGSFLHMPDLEGVETEGNYVVVYSRYGLAGSWAKPQAPDADAYNDAGSVRLAHNILLYAITH